LSTPSIVVGYDGSPSSRAALRLAIDRVGDGRIFVVHAYHAPGDFWGSEHYEELLEHALRRGQAVLDRVAADADPRLAQVDHELELIAGPPAEIIAGVAEARGAESIIIGHVASAACERCSGVSRMSSCTWPPAP